MIRRLLFVSILVVCLAALIVYSQLRPELQTVSGIVEAHDIRLGSRVGGRVEKVHVYEGQQVERDALLIELAPYDLLEKENEATRTLAAREAEYQRVVNGYRPEEIAQKKAGYDQLKARLDLLEAGPRDQEIAASRARRRVAQAALELAKLLHQRNADLIKNRAISLQDFDRTREHLDAAQATLVVREKELEILELGTRDEEIREAQAAVDQAQQAWQMAAKGFRQEEIDLAQAVRDAAQAALDAIRRQKEELEIRSPLTGTVDALDLQPGDMVAPGAPALTILDDNNLWVRAFVPQNRVGLKVGHELKVTADSLPQRSFMGTVTFISRQAEFTPSNVQTPEERSKQVYRVKVAVENQRRDLRPGMTVDVWLQPVEDGT